MNEETMRFELCPDVKARAISDMFIKVFLKKKVSVMPTTIEFLYVMITTMRIPFDCL